MISYPDMTMSTATLITGLRALLANYPAGTLYLKGLRIDELGLIPVVGNKNNYLVFLTQKNDRQTILKVYWPDEGKTENTFESEFLVYKTILRKNPAFKRHIPKIISYSLTGLQYIELEYLSNFSTLGAINELSHVPTAKELQKILHLISTSHLPRANFPPNSALKNRRDYTWYVQALEKMENRLAHMEHLDKQTSLVLFKNIINKYKEVLDRADYFILHDRNPSNILFRKRSIKMIDFEQSGWGNPALDYTLLYVTFFTYPHLQQECIKYLQSTYSSVPYFWERFWIDVSFRIIDLMIYWNEKDKTNLVPLQNVLTHTLIQLQY